jgi:hypothetical protein
MRGLLHTARTWEHPAEDIVEATAVHSGSFRMSRLLHRCQQAGESLTRSCRRVPLPQKLFGPEPRLEGRDDEEATKPLAQAITQS